MAKAAPAVEMKVAMSVFAVGQVGGKYGTGSTGGESGGGNVSLSVLVRLGTGMPQAARALEIEAAMYVFLCWPGWGVWHRPHRR